MINVSSLSLSTLGRLKYRLSARLDQLFRTRYVPERYDSYAEDVFPRFSAAEFVLSELVEAAKNSPGPWLDEKLAMPEYMVIAFREIVEAADATYARHWRRTREKLWSLEDLSTLTRLPYGTNEDRVTCRELAWLGERLEVAMASPYFSEGDPSFLWRGMGSPQ